MGRKLVLIMYLFLREIAISTKRPQCLLNTANAYYSSSLFLSSSFSCFSRTCSSACTSTTAA